MQKKVQEYLQISSNEKLDKATDCQFFHQKLSKKHFIELCPLVIFDNFWLKFQKHEVHLYFSFEKF